MTAWVCEGSGSVEGEGCGIGCGELVCGGWVVEPSGASCGFEGGVGAEPLVLPPEQAQRKSAAKVAIASFI
jgi:hypothetical protein